MVCRGSCRQLFYTTVFEITGADVCLLMDRPTAALSPFINLKSRYWVLGTFLIASVAVGVLYGVLETFQLLPSRAEDPISGPIITIAVWTVVVGTVLRVGRRQGLQVKSLFGQRLPPFSLLHAGLLVLGLLIFSLGSFSIIFYLLSLGFPEYAARILETNMLLGDGSSRYPRLYDGLMLFLLLVYAPLVEELIFRGILLQRWGAKWGLRWGLGASSLMFGLLHFNNPLGLTLFGLVMGLLYVRTRSLWMPIMCHALNNLAAVGIDGISRLTGGAETYTIEDMQAGWWGGLILIGVSAPFLLRFVWLSWPEPEDRIPYSINIGEGNSDRVN